MSLNLSEYFGGFAGVGYFLKEEFTASANQTTFTLSNISPNESNTLVFYGKVLQYSPADYSFSGNDVVFTSGCAAGQKVTVIQGLSGAGPSSAGTCMERDDFVATANQTTFTCSHCAPPNRGNTIVMSGGVLMTYTADYVFSGNDVVFNTGRTSGTKVSVMKFICGTDSIGEAVMVSERQVATANQTVFTLNEITYNPRYAIFVVRNGQILDNSLYTKTNSTTVTLANGALAGDVFEFYTVKPVPTDQGPASVECQTASVGQTVFNISGFAYTPGSNRLLVFVNGKKASLSEYTETSTTSVTFNNAMVGGEEVCFHKI